MKGKGAFLVVAAVLGLGGQVPVGASVLYDRVLSGKELNDEVLAGRASYPANPIVSVSGSRLDLTNTLNSSILYRMPILDAGTLSMYPTLSVRIFVDYVQLTSDNDLGIAISDGTQVLGAMMGDQGRVWILDGPDTGAAYADDYVPFGGLADDLPLTVLIEPSEVSSSSKLTVTNYVGASISFSGLPAMDYDKRMDFILIGDHAGEQYGIDTVRITASTIPAPGAFLLVLSGLACLPAVKKRAR